MAFLFIFVISWKNIIGIDFQITHPIIYNIEKYNIFAIMNKNRGITLAIRLLYVK